MMEQLPSLLPVVLLHIQVMVSSVDWQPVLILIVLLTQMVVQLHVQLLLEQIVFLQLTLPVLLHLLLRYVWVILSRLQFPVEA